MGYVCEGKLQLVDGGRTESAIFEKASEAQPTRQLQR